MMLSTPNRNKDKLFWWKIFCGVNLIMMITIVIIVASMKDLGVLYYMDYLLTFTAGLGLFFFVLLKPAINIVFWRWFFYVFLIESLVFESFGLFSGGLIGIKDITSWVGILYTVALLRALYLYAYRSPAIWKKA